MRSSANRAGRKVVDSANGHQKDEQEESKEKTCQQEDCPEKKAGEEDWKTSAEKGGAEQEESPGEEREYRECGV